MIDQEYTQEVRNLANSGRDVVHQVFTEEEIDWLLDEGDADDGSGIIALAEEAIFRSTGLPVDLAAEGPARSIVVQEGASEGQEHNTFVVVESGINRRDLMFVERDRDTIPKVTPQDANYAARSLDFPMTRPSGTALDGMRIDDRDNPIEQSFVSAITCIQILKHWGVDVSELVHVVSTMWDVDFVNELISRVSLARSEDLDTFLASGGRPPPSVYMSPNVLSRYVVRQSPTVDPSSVGYSQAFTGRAKAMSKFLIATTNVMRGNGAMTEIRTHMNPACMSRFDPESLAAWTIRAEEVESAAHYKWGIPGLKNYATFVDARQAASVALRNDRMEIGKAVFAVEEHDRGRVSLTSTKLHKPINPREFLLANTEVRQVLRHRVPMSADPRRTTAVLLDLYHGQAKPGLYSGLLTSCGELLALCCVPYADLNLALVWHLLERSNGLGECLKGMNILNIEKQADLKAVGDANPRLDRRRIYGILMVKRQVEMMRSNVRDCLRMVLTQSQSRSLVAGLGDIAIERINNIPRLWPAIMQLLARNTRPYTYLNRYKAAAASVSGISSMVEVDSGMVSYLQSGKGTVNTRSLISPLRKHWCGYYRAALRNWQNILHLVCRLTLDRVAPDVCQRWPMLLSLRPICYR